MVFFFESFPYCTVYITVLIHPGAALPDRAGAGAGVGAVRGAEEEQGLLQPPAGGGGGGQTQGGQLGRREEDEWRMIEDKLCQRRC